MRGSVSGGYLFCGFSIFSFYTILIEYYNEVVNHGTTRIDTPCVSSSHTALRLIELLSFISILITYRDSFNIARLFVKSLCIRRGVGI